MTRPIHYPYANALRLLAWRTEQDTRLLLAAQEVPLALDGDLPTEVELAAALLYWPLADGYVTMVDARQACGREVIDCLIGWQEDRNGLYAAVRAAGIMAKQRYEDRCLTEDEITELMRLGGVG